MCDFDISRIVKFISNKILRMYKTISYEFVIRENDSAQ